MLLVEKTDGDTNSVTLTLDGTAGLRGTMSTAGWKLNGSHIDAIQVFLNLGVPTLAIVGLNGVVVAGDSLEILPGCSTLIGDLGGTITPGTFTVGGS